MSFEAAVELASSGRLYPSCILHGDNEEGRKAAALELARALLCERDPAERPCGECKHCRRVVWPSSAATLFHPDFQVLERDLRTSTSVDATRAFLRVAQITPFEGRGQVFVVAAAESLTPEAANAFLKSLEEPHTGSPRHFLLLAPSQFDLLPTLRSRSLSVYLGSGEGLEQAGVTELAASLRHAILAYIDSGDRLDLFAAAGALGAAGNWKDPRARRPWELAAAAAVEVSRDPGLSAGLRRQLLELAEELLTGPDMRVRGIQPQRILEGLVFRSLDPAQGQPA
jgi:hypothetical protein